MTFHESYGELPESLLRLIKRTNVTPAEYDMMVLVMGWSFDECAGHIIFNTVNGAYRAPFPLR